MAPPTPPLARRYTRGTGLRALLFGASAVALSACASPGASGSASTDANGVTRCAEPLGTLAVDDGRDQSWYGPFVSATHVTTVEPLVRLVVQQSNCFTLAAVSNRRLDQRLSELSGDEVRQGPDQLRRTADYYLELAVLFGDGSSGLGGSLGAIGGFMPIPFGGAIGGLVGSGMSQSSTTVTMSLLDIRSRARLAEVEGSTSSSSIGALMGSFGGSGEGVLGGYQRTPAGRSTVVAFVDAYDKLMASMLDRKQSTRAGPKSQGQ